MEGPPWIPVKLLHQPGPILGRTEQGHRFAGNQESGWLSRSGRRRGAQPVRLLAALPGQEAMAQMDAVKEAQSNDAWLVQISSPRKKLLMVCIRVPSRQPKGREFRSAVGQ